MTDAPDASDNVAAVEQRIDEALRLIGTLHPDHAVAVPRGAFDQLVALLHRQQTVNLMQLNLILAVALGRKDMMGDLSDKLRNDLFVAEDGLARFLEEVAAFNATPGSPVN
ncbi:hypothetical protein [Salinarimonas soli]|uniref:Uncharacterized protein n=1 Tax=Salinarimonas soli TaxID=1638099 RepID=A0A5B2V9Q4_9HYPH|nr:hypothetical protein [Salinarimonas soli]KAA2235112.1 hypothetical protein F0L46_21325 [Salinarimonas soli]